MLDATGKFPDGILQGNLNALGSYSACLQISAEPRGKTPFTGKFGGASFYNLGSMDFTDPAGIVAPLYGVCLPSSCTDKDFNKILQAIDIAIHQKFRYVWIPHLSVQNERYHLEGGDIIMMYVSVIWLYQIQSLLNMDEIKEWFHLIFSSRLFLAFLGGLLAAATLLEAYMLFYKEGKPVGRKLNNTK